jgi:hypothetical protein
LLPDPQRPQFCNNAAKGTPLANPRDPPAPPSAQIKPASSVAAWMVVLVAGIFGVLGLINLYAQLMYEVSGVRASGIVREFHRASARSHSIYAQVLAAPPGVKPFTWDVEDSFGLHDWQVGESVPLVCTHIHADHVSCVFDSYADRYLWPVALVAFGGGIAGWGALRLLRQRTAAAA